MANTKPQNAFCVGAGVSHVLAFRIERLFTYYYIGCTYILKILATASFALLLADTNEVAVLLMLSTAQSILFTILITQIALHTPVHLVGCAFGVVEVLNAVASIAGNIGFAFLCSLGKDCFYAIVLTMATSIFGCCLMVIVMWHDLRRLFSAEADQQYTGLT